MGKGKRGQQKNCANSLHDEWGSSSQNLICIQKRIMDVRDFLKAFDLRGRATHGLICKDCLTTCWNKPTYISRLPYDYKTMPAYTMIQQIISNPENQERDESRIRSRSQTSIGEPCNPAKVQRTERGETAPPTFEELEIDGETFCLVPKRLAKYVPIVGIEMKQVGDLGGVEVGNSFAYIPVGLLPIIEGKISSNFDLQQEVLLCRRFLWEKYGNSSVPPFEPEEMRQICYSAGSTKLFDKIIEAMSAGEQSVEKKLQKEKKAVAIIYMLIFGQSQKANWFQKIVATEVVIKGVSGTGLSVLSNVGVAVSKSTHQRKRNKAASDHERVVLEFVEEAYQQKDLLVLMIDDYTNIHTKQRPKDEETSTATSMATILLKRFPGVPAIPVTEPSAISPRVNENILKEFAANMMSSIADTYASVMPPWIRAAFFDPETERHRVSIHDYQEQQSVQNMRKMENCRLIDELELRLKSFNNFLEAAKYAVDHGLQKYLSSFICPQPGDWPAQFYMRQIQHNTATDAPACLKNIVPFIGPLHVQLNARECVCLLHINLFKRAYSYIFGERKILANKPKAWRISVIEEILYGGWTLVRDQVTAAFSNCKDLQYLTLLNLLDNQLPLVLSIYSIIFKRGNAEQFVDAVFRCWLMFFCFKRHHYDKAPLVWLSNVLFWRQQGHPMHEVIMKHLNTLDEYPVENFHSLLRAQSRASDDGDALQKKARALDGNKVTSLNFSSVFATPKKFAFSHDKLEGLKLRAAKFIVNVLQDIKESPNSAVQVPRPKRKQKNMTYWKMPQLYGNEVIGSKIMPLGFQFLGQEPDPNRTCDSNCNSNSTTFKILHGCGHSFHESCLPSASQVCPLCKDGILSAITSLSLKANEAIQNPDMAQEKDGANEVADDDEDETLDVEVDHAPDSTNMNDALVDLQREIVSWGFIQQL